MMNLGLICMMMYVCYDKSVYFFLWALAFSIVMYSS